jgi:uncharacterized protein
MIRSDASSLFKARLGTSLALDVNTGPKNLGDLQVGYLRGTLRAIRVQDGLLVQGSVESQLMLECVRCLEPFDLPVTLELEETYRIPGAGSKLNSNYKVGEDGWLDLAPLIREQAWIAIPMKPLCRPDCQGLCPQCGENRNLGLCNCSQQKVDPRLALLKDLME